MQMLFLVLSSAPDISLDSLVVYAEISEDGEEIDGDSTPDSDDTNDPGGEPNGPTDDVVDNSNGDEDDHDPAVVYFEHFDLALVKGLETLGQINPGDTVSFNITVYNQGSIPADSILLTDYLPSALNLVDVAWTSVDDTTATRLLTVSDGDLQSGGLLPDSNIVVSIRLEIEQTFMDNELVNYAEISGATDENGNPVVDEDSTPDSDPTNDPGGEPNGPTDDVVDNSNGDEDDHDPAVVPVTQGFDLALIETLSPTQSDTIRPGEDIEFKITISNQGTLTADTINVVEYLPAGLSLSINDSNGWSVLNDSTLSILLTAGNGLPLGGLAPDSMQMLFLVLSSAPDISLDSLVVYAEISEDGEEIDGDSTPDSDDTNDPGGEPNGPTDDVVDNSNGDEDDHDPAVVYFEHFDLALVKGLETLGQINPGDTVSFNITVYNQGSIPADSILLTDYLPSALNLVDVAWTSVDDTTATRLLTVSDGDLQSGGLLPDSNIVVSIRLEIEQTFMDNELVNYAEISGATDENGNPVVDEDSTPDSDPTNDPGGEPNGPTDDVVDNSNGDEDDHDPAVVPVTQGFDLALIETLSPTQSDTIRPGEDIEFKITISNQGTLTADTINIVEYLPAGLSLSINDSNGWSVLNDSTLSILLTPGSGLPLGGLAPDSMQMLFLVLSSAPDISLDSLVVYAEISEDGEEIDGDSTPDSDDTNDPGGEPNGPTDDVVDNSNGDEDDHDPAVVYFEHFDLALVKGLETLGQINPGDTVSFNITVYNQGSIPADSILLTDYLPSALNLVDVAWTSVDDTTATRLLTVSDGDLQSGGLLPDSNIVVSIRLEIEQTFMDNELVNYAEISGATDENGNPVVDEDSTPDSDPTNDPGGEPNGPTDDVVDNSNGDEDDHDPAVVPVTQGFDLALIETLSPTQSDTIRPGEDIEFKITISNQGTLTADTINIVEYLPAGLSLSINDSNGWSVLNDSTLSILLTAGNGLPLGGLLPQTACRCYFWY